MIGLGFFLALIFYIGLALLVCYWIRRPFSTPTAKGIAQALTLLTFVLIPTWDIIPGKLYFNHLCETEGGIKIYKTVEGVEGFYHFPGTEFWQEALNQYGYKYLEAGAEPSFYRYSLQKGNLAKENISELSSRYGVQVIGGTWQPLKFNVNKYETVITDIQTNDRLAVMKSFSHGGNWLQRRFKPLLGRGGHCPSEPDYRAFFTNTLKPFKH